MRLVRFAVASFIRARATIGIAVRAVITNRTRALLLVVGIGIGIATVFSIVAMILGLTKSFTNQIAALGANTYYVTSRPWVIRNDWWKYRNRPPITKADLEALRRNATILSAVTPISLGFTDVTYRAETLSNVNVRGTSDEYADIANLTVDSGRFMTPIEVELDQPVAVIGAEVRQQLFHGADPVGQFVYIHENRFRVVGCLKERGTSFGNSLDNLVIMPLGQFQRMFGAKRPLVVAAMAPPERMKAAEEQIIEVLRRSRHLSALDDETFSVNRQDELLKVFREETDMLFIVAFVVGCITLFVGGIGVMNIMLVSVTERTREIGVRRALGARQNTILFQFLLESMFVTMVGGVVGVGLGVGLANLINLISPVEAVTSPIVAVIGVVFSAIVGLIFGTWPAYRAARLDPIESLRYE